MSCKYEHNLI